MAKEPNRLAVAALAQNIHLVRSQKVMLDSEPVKHSIGADG